MPEPLTPGYTTPVYIAGPMRGRPDMNFPAFLHAAERLRALGFEVKCPAEPDPSAGFDPHDLRPALASVLSWIVRHAGAVVVLPGWEQSRGCRAEIAAAQAVGTPVYELEAFLSSGGDAPQVGAWEDVRDLLAEVDRLSALSRLATDRYNELGQLRDAVHREGDTARAERLSFAMQEIRDLFIKAREGGEPRG
jgi:hypothetical protein